MVLPIFLSIRQIAFIYIVIITMEVQPDYISTFIFIFKASLTIYIIISNIYIYSTQSYTDHQENNHYYLSFTKFLEILEFHTINLFRTTNPIDCKTLFYLFIVILSNNSILFELHHQSLLLYACIVLQLECEVHLLEFSQILDVPQIFAIQKPRFLCY
jgi:hypothetical protein